MDEAIIRAHDFCNNNRKQLEKDQMCGCFYCLEIFHSTEIKKWIGLDYNDTALCPYCEIDSVIGESSGFPITIEFLEEMCEKWFLTSVPFDSVAFENDLKNKIVQQIQNDCYSLRSFEYDWGCFGNVIVELQKVKSRLMLRFISDRGDIYIENNTGFLGRWRDIGFYPHMPDDRGYLTLLNAVHDFTDTH
jgi:hypothetical protein